MQSLFEFIDGENPTRIEHIWQKLFRAHRDMRGGALMVHTIAAIDIALWDIAGKAAGKPLHQLLGGARRTTIPAYASLFKYNDPELVAKYTAKALEQGFELVKLHETTVPAVAAARIGKCARSPSSISRPSPACARTPTSKT